ncbi:hypothetical protein [Plesiocystis pacifica]|nr:hypothetical protein [Plesiocystis pacifica]
MFNASDIPVGGFADEQAGNIRNGLFGEILEQLQQPNGGGSSALKELLKEAEAMLCITPLGEQELKLLECLEKSASAFEADVLAGGELDVDFDSAEAFLGCPLSGSGSCKNSGGGEERGEDDSGTGQEEAESSPEAAVGGSAERARLSLSRAEGDPLPLVRRFANLLRLITRHRITIAGILARTYPHVSLFMPALVDYDYWLDEDKRARTPLSAQTRVYAKISVLAAKGRIPWDPAGCRVPHNVALFHGYAPYCPRREIEAPEKEKSLAILLPALNSHGFIGAKLYPPVGFLPYGNYQGNLPGNRSKTDPDQWKTAWELGQCQTVDREAIDKVLNDFYSWASKASNDVPILAHSSPGNVFTGVEPDIAGPEGWAMVLGKHPKLRVCIAHFLSDPKKTRKVRKTSKTIRGSKGATATDFRKVKIGFAHYRKPYSVKGDAAKDHAKWVDSFSWADDAVALISAQNSIYVDMANSKVQEDPEYAHKFFAKLHALFEQSPLLIDRVMWGSDWWLNHIRPNHLNFRRQTEREFTKYFRETAGWSTRRVERVLAKLMGVNALRFTGLFDANGNKVEHPTRTRLETFYESNGLGGDKLPYLLQVESYYELF